MIYSTIRKPPHAQQPACWSQPKVPLAHSRKSQISSIIFPPSIVERNLRLLMSTSSLPTGAARHRTVLKTVILCIAEYGSTL